MYILKVSRGEYEDVFHNYFYSNNLIFLKKKGLQELADCKRAYEYIIYRLDLKKDEVQGGDTLKEIFVIKSCNIKKELNFMRLESMFLKGENYYEFSFYDYEERDTYKIKMEKDKDKIEIKMFQSDDPYAICEGIYSAKDTLEDIFLDELVEKVIEEYKYQH